MAVVCDFDNSAFVTGRELFKFKSEIREEIEHIRRDSYRQLEGIVASYLCSVLPKATKTDVDELKIEIDKIAHNTCNLKKDIILVEGISDREYLLLAIKYFSSSLCDKIDKGLLEIYVDKYEGGVCNITYNLFQRINYKNPYKTMVIYDSDDAARLEYNKYKNDSIVNELLNDRQLKILFIKPNDTLKVIKNELNNMPDFTIEHLLSLDFWKEIKSKNLISKLNKDFIFKFIPKNIDFDNIEIPNYCIKNNKEISDCYFGYYPKSEDKNKILSLVKNKNEQEQKDILIGFKDTIVEIEKFFD